MDLFAKNLDTNHEFVITLDSEDAKYFLEHQESNPFFGDEYLALQGYPKYSLSKYCRIEKQLQPTSPSIMSNRELPSTSKQSKVVSSQNSDNLFDDLDPYDYTESNQEIPITSSQSPKEVSDPSMELDEDMDFDELLINAVKDHPSIYKKADAKYQDKIFKDAEWEAIASAMRTDKAACKRRWERVRQYYARQVKKNKKSYKTGQALDGSLKPIWRHMESMKFINEHIQPRPTRSNDFASPIDEEQFMDFATPIEEHPRKKQKKDDDTMAMAFSTIQETCTKIGNVLLSTASTSSSDESFGQTVALLIKDLPAQEKNSCMTELFNVVMKYRNNV